LDRSLPELIYQKRCYLYGNLSIRNVQSMKLNKQGAMRKYHNNQNITSSHITIYWLYCIMI